MEKNGIINPPYTVLRKKKQKNWSRSTVDLNVQGKIRLLDNNTEYHHDLRIRKYFLNDIKSTIH